MLKAALSGGYVNFGVLRLYGDDALDSAIRIFVKLLESVEQRDLMVWTNISYMRHVLYEDYSTVTYF